MSIGPSLLNVQVAEQFGLEIVSVLPTLHAGGSGQLAAFKFMKDPVEVNLSRPMLDWISETLLLACMLSMFRFDSPSFERNWSCPRNGAG